MSARAPRILPPTDAAIAEAVSLLEHGELVALPTETVYGLAGDATAGLIKGLDLVQLDDNRHYFPPYDAAPVARSSTLLRYPQVKRALEGLAGRITAAQMREMNYAADAQHQNPADVARRFLERWKR